MGCGSSTAAAGRAPLEKDADDFHLEPIDFKPMGIDKYDEFMDQLEDPVNKLVQISNGINDCISDVKEAVAIVLGAYKVEIDVTGVKDHDKLRLSLLKAADGAAPTPEEVKAVYDAAKAADEALAKAREALYKSLERSPVALAVTADLLSATNGQSLPAEAAAFNDALTKLRTAVGATFKVTLAVTPAGAQGAQGVSARLVKPVFRNIMKKQYDLEGVSVLELAMTKQAKAVYAAEQTVAETLGGVTKAMKALPSDQYSFSVKQKKIVVTFPKAGKPVAEGNEDDEDRRTGTGPSGGDDDGGAGKDSGDTDNAADGADGGDNKAEEKSASKGAGRAAANDQYKDQKANLRKAVTSANQQIFKLVKAAASANGAVSIGRGLVALAEAMKKMIQDKVKGASADQITQWIKFKPNVKFGDDGLEFDFDLDIKTPDFEVRGFDQLAEMLPGPVQLVIDAIMGVKDKVVELWPEFSNLKDEVMQAVESADGVFENPMETIKESCGDLGMMEIAKMAQAAAANLKAIKGCADVAKVFLTSAKRIADELTNSVEDINKALA